MTNTKHTPAPWVFEKGQVGNKSDANLPILPVATIETYALSGDSAEANARLIAAAPELLEALELAVKNPDGQWYDVAQAAITKAKGE